MGRILYHASPSRNRAAIQQGGIDWREHFKGAPKPADTRDVTYAPRANYLDERLESAVQYASGRGEPWDVWEVNAEGLNLRPDAAWFKGHTSRARITPDRIKLVWSGGKTAAKEEPAQPEMPIEQFVAQVDWDKPFSSNFIKIEQPDDLTLDTYNPAKEMYTPEQPEAERFVRADILITQALGAGLGAAPQTLTAKAKEKEEPKKSKPKPKPQGAGTIPLFSESKWVPPIPQEEHPAESIPRQDPATAQAEAMSLRGLKLPAPHVFNHELYQQVHRRAPMIPLDIRDPHSIDRALEFMKTARPVMVESSGGATGFFKMPSSFGNKRIDHIMYASWFSIFSANTAVESEETQFVLWQAGKSGTMAGKPGLMSNWEKIGYWLQFLKWAGFPTFENLYRVLEGFDQSDESYERRLTALSRQKGIQFKVASFMLALLGDVRSPTLDMHALSYLIDQGKVKLTPKMRERWTPLKTLLELAAEMKQLVEQNAQPSKKGLVWATPEAKQKYNDLMTNYDAYALRNKNISMGRASALYIKKEGQEPTEPKKIATERKKVKEYIRRQMAGWNGDTTTFWEWYASQPMFTTHERGGLGADAVHSVFFQSLFPELFTPKALAKRKYEDIVRETGEDPNKPRPTPEQRLKYRDIRENLPEMQKLQPRKKELEKKRPIIQAPDVPDVQFEEEVPF